MMMKSKLIAIATVFSIVVVGGFLVSCDGGSDGSSGDTPSPTSIPLTPLLLTEPLIKDVSTVDAARMLTQASFGASHLSLAAITAHPSLEAWVDEQIALPPTLQLPAVEAYGNGSLRPPRHYVWWDTAVNAEDQLRQRVAFALSEIFVVSDIDYTLGNAQHGVVDYYDMLAVHAFGNFRELLEDITLHPVMGIYLSMVRNEKADATRNIRPDENYAREIMQLFTIGLYQLDEGGTPIPVGNPAAAYTQQDVETYARVFTGWNFSDSPEWQSTNLTQYDKETPMVPQEQFHDTGTKQLLGGVVAPAGLSAREDLELALDSLFNHPNVGPFIAKSLIQRLVSSNPSKEYVARVASAFNNNGDGVRGDLGATVKALLLDVEARGTATPTTGKFKEPVLRATHVLRALNAVPGANADGAYHMFSKTSDGVGAIFGQAVLSSPSVFNFFSPDFRSSQSLPDKPDASLYAPELQILNESLVSASNNDLHSLIYNAHNRIDGDSRAAMINLDPPIAMLRMGRDVYLEHMNMLLMSGLMSAEMEAVLADYINETVSANRVELPAEESSTSADGGSGQDSGEADSGESVPADTDNGETDTTNSGSESLSADQIDRQLALLDEDLIQTMVLDTLFMFLASPEYMVQR